LVADNYKKAKEIAAWKQMVVDKWDEIEIKEINLPEDLLYKSCAGETYDISVTIDRKGLPDCLGVELVVSQVIDGQQQPYVVTEMNQVKTDGDLVTYALSYDVNVGGIFKYAFRLFPKNPDLPHRQDFSYVRWF
jgi:starch phosphorylase